MTLLESLTDLEQKLTLWCMAVEPRNDDEVARFAEVVAARARVSQLIDQVELNRARLAANDLSSAASSIARITKEIESTAQEACQGRAVVDKVADAVRIAAQAATVGLGL
jgi:molybdenum cofactor biosynthesis enzyme MoaA